MMRLHHGHGLEGSHHSGLLNLTALLLYGALHKDLSNHNPACSGQMKNPDMGTLKDSGPLSVPISGLFMANRFCQGTPAHPISLAAAPCSSILSKAAQIAIKFSMTIII